MSPTSATLLFELAMAEGKLFYAPLSNTDTMGVPHVSFSHSDHIFGYGMIKYARRDYYPGVMENSFRQTAKIAVFPNIANDKFTVRLQNIPALVSIQLYDQTGRRMSRLYEGEPRNELSFSTKTLATGVYFILVESHGQRFMKKFICVR